MGSTPEDSPKLAVVESVRCLECGTVYAKPRKGGTVRENPGCPECGYVGWMATAPPDFNESWLRRRFVAGHQPYPSG